MNVTYADKYLGVLFTFQDVNEIKTVINYNAGLIPSVYPWAQNPSKPTYIYSEIVSFLGYTPENKTNKGVPNGYAPLDVYSKVPGAYLPSTAFLQKYVFTADGVSDSNGVITGTVTFNLPSTFDFTKVHFAKDGGLFANYTVNITAKTITFTVAPLAVNEVAIFYYSL